MSTVSATYSAAMASYTLRAMLRRGFTSVRDMAGGDHGMRDAVQAGFVEAPRLFICGRAISQTGGTATSGRGLMPARVPTCAVRPPT